MASSSGEGPAGLDIKMLGHEQARSIDELWAGKTDVKERRRLQNRLNRRAYRKRQTELRRQRQVELESVGLDTHFSHQPRRSQIPGVHVFALTTNDGSNKGGSISLNDLINGSDVSLYGTSVEGETPSTSLESSTHNAFPIEPWCRPFEHTLPPALLDAEAINMSGDSGPSDGFSDAVLFEEGLIERGEIGHSFPISSDHFITLIYYNVFRGLSKNIRALKLDMRLMCRREYQSPFITGEIDVLSLAPDFQPTIIQRTIPHHPCFDIFPDAVVRDNAITNWAADMPHGQLCLSVAGRNSWHEMELPARQGCVLWGPADNADNWEVTEAFARKFPYLVQGAYRLQAATNRWRAMRGEMPISFA